MAGHIAEVLNKSVWSIAWRWQSAQHTVAYFVNHTHASQSLIVPCGNQHCYQQKEKPQTVELVWQYIAWLYDVNECRRLSSCSDLLPCNRKYRCFNSLSPWTFVNEQWLNLARSLRALIFLWRTHETCSCYKTHIPEIFPDRCKLIFFCANPSWFGKTESGIMCVLIPCLFLY
jgi:hypothetical protein